MRNDSFNFFVLRDLMLLSCFNLIFRHSGTRNSPRLFRNSDLLKEIIMTKEFMGNGNHNGDDGDHDCDINSEGDVKIVYNFFCQNNCVQNPCKSNATCQSGFTEKG